MSGSTPASGEQVIDVRGLGPGRVAETIVQIAEGAGFGVAASGPNRFRIAKTARPTWANVLALVLAPFFGIGLLFLLAKRTESCEAIIVEDRSGVRVTLNGSVSPSLFMALHTALSGPTAPPVGVTPTAFAVPEIPKGVNVSFTPAQGPHPPRSHEVPDDDRTVTVAQLAQMRSATASALRLADGRILPIGSGLVIGRNPERRAEAPAAQLIVLDDPSLSKTHATFGPSLRGIWVVDEHSTNGTSVHLNGSVTACSPGARVEVPVGATVVIGEAEVAVVEVTS